MLEKGAEEWRKRGKKSQIKLTDTLLRRLAKMPDAM